MFNFVSENLAVYGMWKKNMAEPDMPQMTIWRMRIVSRKPKATNTHTHKAILITIPRQQWLH